MEFAINIKNTREEHWVKLDDILYIKGNVNNCDFVTRHEEFTFRILPHEVMDLIDQIGVFDIHHCARIDKSLIINLNNVSQIKGGKITLSCGDKEVSMRPSVSAIKPLKEKLHEMGKDMQLSYGTGLLNINGNVNAGDNVWSPNEIGVVDLGLPSGLKWGSHNFGVPYPCKQEDYGEHVSWGETASKQRYGEDDDYTFMWGQAEDFEYEEDGEEYDWDSSDQLPDYFDIAHRTYDWRYHRDWHIPTKAEWEELYQYCKFTWCNSASGTRGVLVTGPNGNSIFLPAAGYSKDKSLNMNKDHELAYWSSTYGGRNDELLDMAFAITCKDDISGQSAAKLTIGTCECFCGLSVRPVYGGSLPSSQSREIQVVDDFEYRKTGDDTCDVSHYMPKNPSNQCATIKDTVTFGNKSCKVTGIYDAVYSDILHIGCKKLVIPATIEKLGTKNLHVGESIEVDSNNPAYSSIDGVLFDKEKKTLLRYPDERETGSYKVPNGVEVIGKYAFSDCSIEKIDTNDVTHICEHAFETIEEYYDSVTEFTGPRVKRIDGHAFAYCRQLKNVSMPVIESFGINPFFKCAIREVELPITLKDLHSYIFACDSLETVKMMGLPETVSANPFSKCPNLKTVKLVGVNYTPEEFLQRIAEHTKK